MFCLSKGLGAPAGSMIVGSRQFIEQAVSLRKLLGGGMRQVGVLAAAGLVALRQSPALLEHDHQHARRLAIGLAGIPGVSIDPESVRTNIVIFDIAATGHSTSQLSADLRDRGVLANGISPREMRLVTHYDVDSDQIDETLSILAQLLGRP
jgi:threonine aldolase